MRLRWICLISFLAAFFLTPLIRKLCFKFDILDHPHERKVHKEPTPLLGGLAIYLAVIVSLSYNAFLSPKVFAVLGAGSLVFILGLIDDIRPLSATIRLIGQIGACIILISSDIYLELFPRNAAGFFFDYLITIIWVVGIINAVNYLDGVDGLLTILAIVMLGCFFYIGFFSDQFFMLNLIIALAAALLGFLKYNFPSAKIFLGDGGSTFIGFMLAAIAIMGNWAQDNIVKVFVPIFVLGVPIFDMCFTTVMRIKEKKVKNVKEWLEYAGKDHFHHRLLNIGFGKKGVVYFISVVSLALGISAIVLYNSEVSDVYFMLLQAICIFVVIAILMVLGERIKCS